MSRLGDLHREAMLCVDRAECARRGTYEGNPEELLREALRLECEAANSLSRRTEEEPTRSVLYRSAASLALDCMELREAERLIGEGLAGQPPEEIADELRDLFEQVNFHRHLDLRGIVLEPGELQLSLAGKAVGFGITQSELFMSKVQFTGKLLRRTAERCLNRPFRSRGRSTEDIVEDTELYVTIPRAASFAVSFRVGHPKEPQLPGMQSSVAAVDEALDCLDLYNRADEAALRTRIPDEDYYTNFIALAQHIAPDGTEISLVGFTAVRADGQERRVELTRFTPTTGARIPKAETAREPLSPIVGTLLAADAIRTNEIKLVDSNNKAHSIVVPEGMMDDIVRPHWDDLVEAEVETIPRSKRLRLRSITKAK